MADGGPWTKHRAVVVSLGVALLAAGIAGSAAFNSSSVPPALYASRQAGGGPIALTMLNRVMVDRSGNLMTTSTSRDWTRFPLDGSIAYIAKSPVAGTLPLHRFFSRILKGYRDCTCSSVPGYQLESTLGFLWSSPRALPGLDAEHAILLGHRGPDYATYLSNARPAGYIDDRVLGYGYTRDASADVIPLSVRAGDTTVTSNLAAGGVLWNWVQGGVQYINTADFGREIQTEVWFSDNAGPLGYNPKDASPNEAGDAYSYRSLSPAVRHGSVLYSARDLGANQQSTRALPIEWYGGDWGGSIESPVLWPNMRMGKDLVLQQYPGLGVVAQYDAVIDAASPIFTWHSANPLSSEVRHPRLETAIYLNPQFNRFWTYVPGAAKGPVEVHPAYDVAGGTNFHLEKGGYYPSGQGGIIISTSDGSHAMGLYAVDRARGGSTDALALVNVAGQGTNVLVARVQMDSIPAGVTRWRTWMMSGSLQAVTGMMQALYEQGVR